MMMDQERLPMLLPSKLERILIVNGKSRWSSTTASTQRRTQENELRTCMRYVAKLRRAFAGCTATKNRLNYLATCSGANPRRANLEKRLASRRVMKIN